MSAARMPQGLESLGRRTLVMGVLNVTPDSFSDGGRFAARDDAMDRARQMASEGADILDVGGESTRPGAEPVSLEEELNRVIPVVEALSKAGFGPALSVDTTKAEVARQALDVGAAIVNDISGLNFDPEMVEVLAASPSAHAILGHTRGLPKTMQVGRIEYERGVVGAVMGFLSSALDRAVEAGIDRDRLLVDPGFGFGKTLEHNCTLLRELDAFGRLGAPVVVGTSRKSFLGTLTHRSVGDRSFATASSVALAVAGGAAVVRVHDVAPMVDVVRVADAVVRGVSPAVSSTGPG